MLTNICPKLPMHDKRVTENYYVNSLGFSRTGVEDYEGYLMLKRDNIEIHFFEFRELDPRENYGQVYIRTTDIDYLYRSLLDLNVPIHPNAPLETKPWGQREFALLDPDNNLLTFGQAM